jgi:hypothetical protein
MQLHFAASRLNFVYIAVVLLLSSLSTAQTALKKERLSIAQLPIQFEPNYGQGEPATRFVAHLPTLELILRAREFDLHMTGSNSQSEDLGVRFVDANVFKPCKRCKKFPGASSEGTCYHCYAIGNTIDECPECVGKP